MTDATNSRMDRGQRVAALFHVAIDMASAHREAWLLESCADDASIRREVLELAAIGDRLASSLPMGESIHTGDGASDQAGIEIPGFVVQGRLSHGGFGTVYLAAQQSPARLVAIKVITRPPLDAESDERIRREGDLLAQLVHPGLAVLHEVGTTSDGRVYFSMEYLRGRRIGEHCEVHRLGLRERVLLLAEVCDAVAHAHRHDVTHLDLKPANVLLKEDVPDARPKVVDFGIARVVEDPAAAHIGFTSGRGTIPYASPEQLRGDRAAMGPWCDVHALGVMLRELIDPLRSPMPHDLACVAARATETDPGRRYPSARELSDDLRRHLGGFPVHAAPASRWNATRKFVGRHPWAVSGAMVVAATVAVGFALTYAAWRQTVYAMGVVDTEREARTRQAYLYGIRLAETQLAGGDAVGALRRLSELPEDLRNWEWRHLVREADSRLRVFTEHEAPVRALAITPDSTTLVTGDWIGRIIVRELESGRVLRTLGAKAGVTRLCIDERSGQIVAGCDDGAIRIWDEGGEEPVATIKGFRTGVNGMDVADGRVAAASQDTRGRIWDLATHQQVAEVDGGRHLNLRGLRFLPDGAVLWPMSSVEIREPNLSTVRSAAPLDGQSWSSAVDVSGRRVAIGTTGGIVHLFSLDGLGALARHSTAGTVRVAALAFPPRGGPVIAGLQSGAIQVFGEGTFEPWVAHGGEGQVSALACSPDGRWLVGGFEDATVGVWSMDSVLVSSPISARTVGGRSAFSPDGARFVSPSGFRGATIRDAVTGEALAQLVGHWASIGSMAYHEDGDVIVTASADRTVRLWDAATGTAMRSFQRPGAVAGAAFRPGWRSLASITSTGEIELVDFEGRTQWSARAPAGSMNRMVFDPTGVRLYTSHGHEVREWDLVGSEPTRSWRAHEGVCAIDFDHRHKLLAVATVDGFVGAIELGGAGGGAIPLHDVQGDGIRVESAPPRRSKWTWGLSLSPDATRLVTVQPEATRLWEWPTMIPLLTFRSGDGAGNGAATFSPDGERIAVGHAARMLDSVDESSRVEERVVRQRARRALESQATAAPAGSSGSGAIVSASDPTVPDAVFAVERANAELRAAERGRTHGLDHWIGSIEAHLVSVSRALTPLTGAGMVAGSAVGNTIAIVTGPGRIDVLDLAGARRHFVDAGWRSIDALAVDRSGITVAAACGVNVAIHEFHGTVPSAMLRLDSDVTGLALPANGDLIVGCRDGSFTVRRGTMTLGRVAAHREPITGLASSDDGRLIATCSADGSAHLWRWPVDGAPIAPQPATTVRSVAVDGAGSLIALGLGSGAVEFWRLDASPPHAVRVGSDEADTSAANATIGVAFSASGDLVVASHLDGTLTVWRAADGALVAVLDAGAGLRPDATFCGNGALLCSVNDAGELRLWDAAALARSRGEWADILGARRRAVAVDTPVDMDAETSDSVTNHGTEVEMARALGLLRLRRSLGMHKRRRSGRIAGERGHRHNVASTGSPAGAGNHRPPCAAES